METYVLMLQTDPDDQYITESALAEIQYTVPVKFISGIHELDDFTATSGLPAVILMNVSGINYKGVAIIRDLKANPAYSHIPVVVLGEISADDYIRQWYRAGANSFIIKPSTVEETKKKIRTFFEYWFDVAKT
jgi:DNA-binding NarL/FixJ family response regulator